MRLDIGCGTVKKEGFIGIDTRQFPGVDVILDAGKDRWPWDDCSVEEVHCSHMVEHLKPAERIHFVNELYRVLKPDAKAAIITPHWASIRAYGDLSHEWPPVSEMWFYYLSEKWRATNAPHLDSYKCNFEATWGYSVAQELQVRSADHQQFAVKFYKEAAQDMAATLVKK